MRRSRVSAAALLTGASILCGASSSAALEPPVEIARVHLRLTDGDGELVAASSGATERADVRWDGTDVAVHLALTPSSDLLEANLLMPGTIVTSTVACPAAVGAAAPTPVSMLELRVTVGEHARPTGASKEEAAARELATPMVRISGLRMMIGGTVRELREMTVAAGRVVSLVEFAPEMAGGFELDADLSATGDRTPIELELSLLTGSRVVARKEGSTTGGSLRSADGGLLCGPDCKQSVAFVAPGTSIELLAEPTDSGTIAGWSGGCTTLVDNRVAMTAPEQPTTVTCTVAFTGPEPDLAQDGRDGTWTNPSTITVPESGAATPYPSSILVEQAGGAILDVDVTLSGIYHTFPDDLDILLISASGDSVVLMSDACGGTDLSTSINFDDEAPGPMPDSGPCSDGWYFPTDYDGGDAWPAPAPGGSHGSMLAELNAKNPNGLWSLYVHDDSGADSGSIAGGWSISLVVDPAEVVIPATGTGGPAAPYPVTMFHALPVQGPIADVEIVFNGVFHTYPDDLDMLLVSPKGTGVVLMSDACGSQDVTSANWIFSDDELSVMPDEGPCTSTPAYYLPSNYGAGDSWPAPAPPGPYAASFAAFDGENPYGEWKLFVTDDTNGDAGFIEGGHLYISVGGTSIAVPGNGSVGPGEPYPLTLSISGLTGEITGATVEIPDLHHSFGDDVGLLLQSPAGTTVLLMANACGGRLDDASFWLNDGGPAMPDDGPCSSAVYRPTAYGTVEFPAPAPAGPYATSLAAFIGEPANGAWKLWAVDDSTGDVGFFGEPPILAFSLEVNFIFVDGFETGDTARWSASVP